MMMSAQTASTSLDLVTSSFAPWASTFNLRNSATVASMRSGIKSATTTFAPASPRALAQAAPIPCPAPVTTATFPSSFNFSRYILLPSTHPLAAVDVVGLGDDIIAFFRCQKNRHADEIFRSTHAPVRNAGGHLFFLFADGEIFILGEERIHAFPMLAIDNARGNGIYIDAVLDEIEARRLREADDSGLAGAIDGNQCFTSPARLACHVY